MKYQYTHEELSTAPDFLAVANLSAGIYPAAKINPPSGDDCTHLLVRDDRTLGWCNEAGEQSEDSAGRVSTFSAVDLSSDA